MNALARFQQLQILDPCASVTWLYRLSMNGRDISDEKQYFGGDCPIPEDTLLPSTDEMMAMQRRATLRIAAKCPSLCMVAWNASGWAADCGGSSAVWVWRINNGEDGGCHHYQANGESVHSETGLPCSRSAVCEGQRKRYSSSLSSLFRDMRSLE